MMLNALSVVEKAWISVMCLFTLILKGSCFSPPLLFPPSLPSSSPGNLPCQRALGLPGQLILEFLLWRFSCFAFIQSWKVARTYGFVIVELVGVCAHNCGGTVSSSGLQQQQWVTSQQVVIRNSQFKLYWKMRFLHCARDQAQHNQTSSNTWNPNMTDQYQQRQKRSCLIGWSPYWKQARWNTTEGIIVEEPTEEEEEEQHKDWAKEKEVELLLLLLILVGEHAEAQHPKQIIEETNQGISQELHLHDPRNWMAADPWKGKWVAAHVSSKEEEYHHPTMQEDIIRWNQGAG